MTDDYIIRIEAALEAGPTMGPWKAHIQRDKAGRDLGWIIEHENGRIGWASLAYADTNKEAEADDPARAANAHLIAACNPVAIRALLDRLKAAEAENERLKCNAMQWRKPGPVTAEHPLDCLIVVPALRQADGDWWIGSSEFLTEDAPIAWCADTSIARAALENTDAR